MVEALNRIADLVSVRRTGIVEGEAADAIAARRKQRLTRMMSRPRSRRLASCRRTFGPSHFPGSIKPAKNAEGEMARLLLYV